MEAEKADVQMCILNDGPCRKSVLVCSVSEPGDIGFPVYLACPVTGLTGVPERRFRKCFLSP